MACPSSNVRCRISLRLLICRPMTKKVAGMFSFRRISSIFGVVESVGPSSNVRQIVFISVSLGCGSFMQEDAAGRGGENKRAVASTSALMNLIMQSVCPKNLISFRKRGVGKRIKIFICKAYKEIQQKNSEKNLKKSIDKRKRM